MTIEHIVLTTDLSDESLRAFAPVGALAQKLGAKITVLYVVPAQIAVPYGYPYVPPASPAALAEYRSALQKKLDETRKRLPAKLEVQMALVESEGRADQAICAFAEKIHASAIAMATHGHAGVRRFFLGSIAESVVRSAHVPVLLYPPAKA